MDLYRIIDSLEQEVYSMNEDQKVRVLATILYPNESYGSLTQTQLEISKIYTIMNKP